MHHLSALPGRGGTHRGPRHRVERFSQRRNACGLRSPRRHGPPIYPLYLGHDRRAQGRGAGQRRPPGGAQMVDAKRVRRVAGRGVLGGVRRRLGSGAFLHHLCAADSWLHHHPLRGQARGHAGCGCFLAHHLRARGRGFSSPRRRRFRAIKRDDPDADLMENYDLSRFRTLFLAGERSDSDTIQWAEEHLQVPVIDHYWQTESGWPMLANSMGIEQFPVKYGSPSKPVPGYDFEVLDSECRPNWGRARWARCASNSPCRPGVSPRCGMRTSASSTPI